jgi:PAS domain S-box-containing protein
MEDKKRYDGLNTTLIQTLRKKIEALRESEEKFKAIFDNASDGILLADLITKKFAVANKTMCEMLGYSEDELKKLSVNDIHPKEDLPYVLSQFEKQAKKEIALAKDIPAKRKDGRVFYADINSMPVKFGGKTYLAGIFRDITERRKAEEELKKSAFYLDSIADVLIVVDLSGKVIKVNKPAFRLFGYSQKEIIGKSIFKLFSKEESAKHKEQMQIAAKTGTARKFETIALTKNKKKIPLSASGLAMKDKKGKLIGFIAIFADITERKKAEDKFKETKEKYEKEINELKRKLKARRKL